MDVESGGLVAMGGWRLGGSGGVGELVGGEEGEEETCVLANEKGKDAVL